VIAKFSGLSSGAGFLLYVQDGVLHMLEGYTYDEPWPQEPLSFELSYASGGQRDAKVSERIV
jgi:hypothetical protein